MVWNVSCAVSSLVLIGVEWVGLDCVIEVVYVPRGC